MKVVLKEKVAALVEAKKTVYPGVRLCKWKLNAVDEEETWNEEKDMMTFVSSLYVTKSKWL